MSGKPRFGRKCIFISGMHRSGTSAISGSLLKLGAELGRDLMPPDEYNLKGYFESNQVYELNQEILNFLGVGWDITFLMDEKWSLEACLQKFGDKIKRILFEDYNDAKVIVLKDPRFSVVVPLWNTIAAKLGFDTSHIVMLRHPIEVCQSLGRRENFSWQKSLLLWLDYNCRVERQTRKQSRIFVNYDDLIHRPIEVLTRINNALSLHLPARNDLVNSKILDFLDPHMQHHRASSDFDLSAQSKIALELYERLNILCLKQPDEEKEIEDLNHIENHYFYNIDLFSRTTFEVFKPQVDRLLYLKEKLETELTERKEHQRELEENIANLEEVIQKQEEQVFAKRSQVEQKNTEIRILRDEVKSLVEENESYRQNLISTNKELADKSLHVERLVQEIEFKYGIMYKMSTQILQKKSILKDQDQDNTQTENGTRTESKTGIDSMKQDATNHQRDPSSTVRSSRYSWTKKFALIPSYVGLFVTNPLLFIRNITVKNLQTFVRALTTEPPDLILQNSSRAIHRTKEIVESQRGNLGSVICNIDDAYLLGEKVVYIRGWVLSIYPLLDATLKLGTEKICPVRIDQPRPDVFSAYPGFSHQESAGFIIWFKKGVYDFDSKSLSIVFKTRDTSREIAIDLDLARDPLTLDIDQQFLIFQLLNERNESETNLIKNEIRDFSIKPRISIITPVFNVDPEWLDLCVQSVLDQIYENWELCLYDDASTNQKTIECLKKWSVYSEKISVRFGEHNSNISIASNEAIRMSTGAYLGFLDHDDELEPEALYEVVRCLNQNPELELIYSDECLLEMDGTKKGPYFKSDFNIDLLRSNNYICHFTVIRRSLGERIGWFEKGLEGAQDHDLILKAVDHTTTDRIFHIPRILYNWRKIPGSTALSYSEKSNVFKAGQKAIEQHLYRNGIAGKVLPGKWGGAYKVEYTFDERSESVSIIIPFRDQVKLLQKCIDSLYLKTNYDNFDVILVDNNSKKSETKKYLRRLVNRYNNIRIINYPGSFNFSAINNWASTFTNAKYVLFLNNDTEIITVDWLTEMVSHCQRKEVGAVGAKLLYDDGSLQHAGVVLGIGGVAGHAFKGKSDALHYYNMGVVRNVSACTAACLLVRRTVFNEVSGFDEENLKIAYNDVDLCLKIRQKGYLIVFTPYAELYHHESKTRGYEDTPEKKARYDKEKRFMIQKWGGQLNDPYYNKNLTTLREDYSLNLF